jgi:DNA repair ATPase RecN
MERSIEDSIKNKTYISDLRSAAKYSQEVIDLVEADIEYGLTKEQTQLYLKRNIKFPQMKLLSQCLRKGADKDFVELLTKYDMSGHQIQVAIEFWEKGVSIEHIEAVIANGDKPAIMRKEFEEILEKVKQVKTSSEIAPDYVKGLVKQIEEAVAKIQFQEERYDELNKKLKVFENSKKDEEVHKGLVKKLEDTEAELSGQQDQLNRANATIARLREQIDEKEKEMEKMQNRIDTLEDKLLEKAAGATV